MKQIEGKKREIEKEICNLLQFNKQFSSDCNVSLINTVQKGDCNNKTFFLIATPTF